MKIKNQCCTIKNISLNKVDKYASGLVEISMPDGTLYNGEIKLINGLFYFDGKGKAMFNDGSTYEGSWEKGKMHGKGVYEWVKDKIKYEG